MGWPVILTEQSQEDLREILCCITQDSPECAGRFGNDLMDRALSIASERTHGR